MKKFRSSFNHLVREKLIAGVDDNTPPPETRSLVKLYPDVIVDHAGTFEYQIDDLVKTTGSDTWITQGAMGYGPAPVSDGTTPYRCFMSNKKENNMILGTYTGSTTAPHITFKELSHTGVGTTFATGVAQQYVATTNNDRHAYTPGTTHTLATVYGIRAESSAYAAGDTTDYDDVANGRVEFCYECGSNDGKTYSLFVNVVDSAGVESRQASKTGLHFYSSYGRLMPVSLVINAAGTFEFRVDATTITGDITQLQNNSSVNLSMPSSGKLNLRLAGLLPTPHTPSYHGMGNPISRVTNVAVNDNDDTDGLGDIGLPPFIIGIPCTPVRNTTTDWDLPLQVIDPTAGWIPYSESSPTVEYGLSAVADSQLFDTRGVATSADNRPLHVYTANTTTLNNDLSALGVANLSGVESINTMMYDSAVLDDDKSMTVRLSELGTFDAITTSETFSGIQSKFDDSAVTFFQDATGGDMNIDTFTNGMVFTLNVSGGQD